MAKELVTKTNGSVAPVVQWGAREEVNADNFLISKILPMQLTSPLVKDDKAKFGEIRDSVTGELLAPLGKPLAFVPVELREYWMVNRLEGKNWVFEESIPYNNSNRGLAREETVNGVQIKRMHCMDYYVLLMNDLLKGIDFPKTISFRSTSLRAGKVLYTRMYALNQRAGLSPAGMIMAVSTKRVDGELGSYVTLEVTPVEQAHADYVECAKKWFDLVRAGKTQIDETEAGTV